MGAPNLEKVRGPKGGAHKGGSKPTLAILIRPTLAKPTLANVNCSGFFVCVELSWVVRRVGVRSKGGVRRMGVRRVGGPKCRAFFPSPATKFVLFFPHTNTHKHTQTHTKTHKDTQRHTKTHKDTQKHTTHNTQHPQAKVFWAAKVWANMGGPKVVWAKVVWAKSGLTFSGPKVVPAKSGAGQSTGQKWSLSLIQPCTLDSALVLMVQSLYS